MFYWLKFKILVFITLLFSFSIAFAFDDGDFQYWNNEAVSWQVRENLKADFEVEFRYGDDASNFYYQHSDLGFTYSGIAKWLDLGINYRQIFEEKSSVWRYENVPHFNATLKWKLANFSFSNRGRFEYKDREEADNYWRYRNKFTIKAPLKLTKFNIQPYVADEIFYDFDAEALNKNRLYGGFVFKITKNLSGEIFNFWQASEANDKWTDLYALGTKLKLTF